MSEDSEFIDCPKHGRFLWESTECPGCQNEKLKQAKNEAKSREQRLRTLTGSIRARAERSIRERIQSQRDPTVGRLSQLLEASKKHENAKPAPPNGLLGFLKRAQFLQLIAAYESESERLAQSIERSKAELATIDSRWTPETVQAETEREFQAACRQHQEVNILLEEVELRKQKIEARRRTSEAELKRLRPDFQGAVKFVPHGSTVTGTVIAASQLDGSHRAFLDTGKSIYSIPLNKLFLGRIPFQHEYYRPREDECQTITIRDFDNSDDL